MNMSSLEDINKLTNMLIPIYSYNISREEGKKLIFKNEFTNIVDKYNEINQNSLINTDQEFEDHYVKPFINSWNK